MHILARLMSCSESVNTLSAASRRSPHVCRHQPVALRCQLIRGLVHAANCCSFTRRAPPAFSSISAHRPHLRGVKILRDVQLLPPETREINTGHACGVEIVHISLPQPLRGRGSVRSSTPHTWIFTSMGGPLLTDAISVLSYDARCPPSPALLLRRRGDRPVQLFGGVRVVQCI